jgi:hypothetical protein
VLSVMKTNELKKECEICFVFSFSVQGLMHARQTSYPGMGILVEVRLSKVG